MFGNIRSAEDWNRITGTDKGHEIYDALWIFHERPIKLKPALPDLDSRLASALRCVGIEAHHAAAISLAALSRSIDVVPEAMRPWMARDIAGAVQRSLKSHLDDDVRDWAGQGFLSTQHFHDVIHTLADGISRPVRDHLVQRHGMIIEGTSMGNADLPFPLLGLLVDLVDAICAGDQAKAQAIQRLNRIILDGNLPMGSVPRRRHHAADPLSYAVLVA